MEGTLVLDSNLAELQRLTSWIDDFSAREGVPENIHYHLNVALEELVINAIKHGRCQQVQLAMSFHGGVIRMEMSDDGIPFNPLEAPEPNLAAGLADRPVGGLGIHLVRCLLDSIQYERRDGRNLLYLTKRAEAQPQ